VQNRTFGPCLIAVHGGPRSSAARAGFLCVRPASVDRLMGPSVVWVVCMLHALGGRSRELTGGVCQSCRLLMQHGMDFGFGFEGPGGGGICYWSPSAHMIRWLLTGDDCGAANGDGGGRSSKRKRGVDRNANGAPVPAELVGEETGALFASACPGVQANDRLWLHGTPCVKFPSGPALPTPPPPSSSMCRTWSSAGV
jgi:hypothetical protein